MTTNYVEVKLKRRSFVGRLLRVPHVFMVVYRSCRPHASRFESAKAAWGLTYILVRPKWDK